MIWGKRRFKDADYSPYMNQLDKLAMLDVHRQYAMVSIEANEAGVGDYFVGVPDEISMRHFDEFVTVSESELPSEVDVLHFDSGGVRKRFRFKRIP
jgi:hypothetical protein